MESQAVFQAETQAKIVSIELGPCHSKLLLGEHIPVVIFEQSVKDPTFHPFQDVMIEQSKEFRVLLQAKSDHQVVRSIHLEENYLICEEFVMWIFRT